MSELIKRLTERRANVWEQAKGILDAAEAENRDLSAEERAAFDTANTDLDEIRAQIDMIAEAEQRNRDAEAALTRIGSVTPTVPGEEDLSARFRQLARGELRSIDMSATEMRDLTKGTASSGGATVPTGFYGQLWEHVIDTAQLINYCTVITTEGGNPIQFPATTTHSTGALIAENSTVTESDPAFVQRTLSSYKYAVAIQAPNELIEDTGVDLEGYLARQAGRAVGNALGVHLVTGDGSAKPYGLMTNTTLGVTGSASVSGAFSADNLIDLFYSVSAGYRNSDKAGWMMRDASIAAVRKLKGSDNNYLWQPGLQAGQPDLLLGKPIVADPNVAAVALSAKSVAFGDLSAYYVRVAGGIRFEKSTEFAFGTDQTTYRCVLRADGVLLDQTGAVKHFIGNAA